MNTSNWKWFRYDHIFDIKKGFYNKKPEEKINGEIPFIGATDSNNGITSLHDLKTIEMSSKTGEEPNAPLSEKMFSSNCITVSNNGSVGYAFYQNRDFTCTHDVNPLYLNKKWYKYLNVYIAMFLCTIIEQERFRWAYGRKWRPKRMPDSLIKLPVDILGNPNWQWIENYVKETLIPKLPTKVKSVWEKCFETNSLSKNKLQLNTQKWQWFRIGYFFDAPYKATAYNAIDLISCNKENENSIAYITRTDVNNGCKDYVINEDFTDIERGNAITIGDTTATIYYQENKFICGDHMVVLRSKYLNKYVGLFITSLLNKERFRYNYGRAFNKGIIANTRIKLPIDQFGNPDWQWMEDYIKGLPYSGCL